jgi:nicotinate-nucleotide adenylyltransferase
MRVGTGARRDEVSLRLGVLGGTFDPPHVGHLISAGDAFESLKLDRLVFIPVAAQPLKTNVPAGASPQDRLEMVRMAIAGDSRFAASDTEIRRGGLSYTVDTLETLKQENPGATLVLIVGMDALAAFDRWKNPERIREIAEIAVLSRTGDHGVDANVGGGVTVVGTRRIDISSSEIRQRLAEGKSIRGFVAESVEEYIATRNLYRTVSQRDATAPITG